MENLLAQSIADDVVKNRLIKEDILSHLLTEEQILALSWAELKERYYEHIGAIPRSLVTLHEEISSIATKRIKEMVASSYPLHRVA